MAEKIEEVIGYGQDLGNTFLLTGLVASVVWLQNINPGIAPVFLIAGGFIVVYTKWLKQRNIPKKDALGVEPI